MRVQMRLSSESQSILSQKKTAYEEKEQATVTYGWLVNQAVRKVCEGRDISTIDWTFVRGYPLHLVDEMAAEDCTYNITLNLQSTVLDYITQLQLIFRDVFHAARVHRGFAVRMALKAEYLMDQNVEIVKKEEP